MRRQSQGWQMRLQPRTAEGRRPPGEAGTEAWLPREHGPAHTLMSEARPPDTAGQSLWVVSSPPSEWCYIMPLYNDTKASAH